MNEKVEKRFANVSKSVTFRNIVDTYDLGNKEVLDIGCSFGEFVAHFGKGSTGVTIAKDEAEYGTQRGLDIRYGNIEDESFSLEKKYDVIFANNIFEHLYSPHYFLYQIRKYLKPGGILILGVPCIPTCSWLLRFKKFRGSMAVAHINFFTKQTLRYTAIRGGWLPMAVRGFHFKHPVIDHLFDLVYPHFYVVAHADPDFAYTAKRMKELIGYDHIEK